MNTASCRLVVRLITWRGFVGWIESDGEGDGVVCKRSGTRAMYLEFVVLGPPVSNQSQVRESSVLENDGQGSGRVEVEQSAAACGKIEGDHHQFSLDERPFLDLDNMSKPIWDEMQNVVYEDDRQIRQLELTHEKIDAPFVIVGASPLLLEAVRAGNQFVYARIDEPVDPLPLPKGHHGL